jgi:hypothetical protein
MAAIALVLSSCELNGVSYQVFTVEFSVPAGSSLIGQKIFMRSQVGSLDTAESGITIVESANSMSVMRINDFSEDYSEDVNLVAFNCSLLVGEANLGNEAAWMDCSFSVQKTSSEIHDLTKVVDVNLAPNGFDAFDARLTLEYSFGAWY